MFLRAILDAAFLDVCYALRSFRREPAFTLTSIAVLALGLGAATSVFSAVDRLLFRSLPYRDDSRLVSVGLSAQVIARHDWLFSATYQEWRAAPQPFAALTSWAGVSGCDLTQAGSPTLLACAQVEASFLPTLGISPLLGRNFTPAEDQRGSNQVALISYGLWRSRFGARLDVLGQRLILDGDPVRVIGVLPASFELPTLDTADILRPEALLSGAERQRLVRVVGRLQPGMTVEDAALNLQPRFQRFLQSVPQDFRRAVPLRLRVQSLREMQVHDLRLASTLLLAAALAVLLMACANLANLNLARAAHRQREFAIRAALGARGARLIGQSLIESLLLAFGGGLAGWMVAGGLLRLLLHLAPEGMPRLQQASLDLRVFGFTAALCLVSAISFGLAPALRRQNPEALGRGPAGRRSSYRLGQVLMTSQIAISTLLLTAAGLLLTSFWNLQSAPLGLQPERVLTATLVLSPQRYANAERQIAFFTQLESRLRELPGVTAAAITDSLPPGGDPRTRPFVALKAPGGDAAQQDLSGLVIWRYVTPEYFAVLGTVILRGRSFRDEDRRGDGQPVVINQALAARLFGGADPVGQRIGTDLIVGLSADAKNSGLAAAAAPEYYFLRKHRPDDVFANQRPPYGWRRATAIVRTSLATQVAADLIRAELAKLDPALPVEVGTLKQQVAGELRRPRFQTTLLLFFALSGLVLAGSGLYGLMSYLMSQRTRELGIRLALGARGVDISRLVLRQASVWTLTGLALGLAGAYAVGRLMAALLFEVTPGQPHIFVSSALLFAAVTLAALWPICRSLNQTELLNALRRE